MHGGDAQIDRRHERFSIWNSSRARWRAHRRKRVAAYTSSRGGRQRSAIADVDGVEPALGALECDLDLDLLQIGGDRLPSFPRNRDAQAGLGKDRRVGAAKARDGLVLLVPE